MASCSFLTALQHPSHCPSVSSFKPHDWTSQTVLKTTILIHASINLPPDLLVFTFSSCTIFSCLWLRKSQALLARYVKDFSEDRAIYGSFSVLFLHDAFQCCQYLYMCGKSFSIIIIRLLLFKLMHMIFLNRSK